MSEADNTPRRRPPTIDLTAKEVETAQPAPQSGDTDAPEGHAAAEAAAAPSKDEPGRVMPVALGALIGAVIGVAAAGLVAAGLWFAGFGPVREIAAPQTAMAPTTNAAPPADGGKIAADSAEISSRLDKIEQALRASQPDAGFATRLAAAEAQAKSLDDALGVLSRRVDDVAAASQVAVTQAKAAAAAADGVKSAASTGATHDEVEALTSRIAALENTVKALASDVAQRTSVADDKTTRTVVAAEALRSAVERGAPYQAELAAVKSLGADAEATSALDRFAADGVPSAVALGRDLTKLTAALLPSTDATPGDGSLLGRLQSHMQKLVRVTPVDATASPGATGGDPGSTIARIDAAAARGDIDAARAEIARLPDAARAQLAGWVKKAEARDAALAACRHIAADALAALGKPVSQ